jgi:CRISPR-associated protein Cas1
MKRVIEIVDSSAFLSLSRGFLQIERKDKEKAQIAINDIEILVLNAVGNSITTNLLNSLLEAGAFVILLGKNYIPSGIFYPTNPHHLYKNRIDLQIEASLPLKKRLWQVIIKAKIQNQAAILSHFSGNDEKQLIELSKKVSSGDKENLEAQAAKKYWQKLFGSDFRRNFNQEGINSALNYGYAIIRSATARAVFASGLLPSLGLHHSNQGNAFCLVDDLMEPFRPIVDFVVKKISEENKDLNELTPEIKKKLSGILILDLSTNYGVSTLTNCLTKLSQSLVKSFEKKEVLLEFPASPTPLELLN